MCFSIQSNRTSPLPVARMRTGDEPALPLPQYASRSNQTGQRGPNHHMLDSPVTHRAAWLADCSCKARTVLQTLFASGSKGRARGSQKRVPGRHFEPQLYHKLTTLEITRLMVYQRVVGQGLHRERAACIPKDDKNLLFVMPFAAFARMPLTVHLDSAVSAGEDTCDEPCRKVGEMPLCP